MLRNSVIIRVNKFLLLFISSIFISTLIGYFFLVQKYLTEMCVLNQKMKIQLDLLEQRENVVTLVAHSSHNSKFYWGFLSENVDPVLVAVVIGAFVAGCYLGSQGFFSYGTLTEKNFIPSFLS